MTAPEPPMPPQTDLAELLTPATTAVLVIDMQNDFVHTGGVYARMGNAVEDTQAVVEPLNAFLATARRAGASVIALHQITDEHTRSAARDARRRRSGQQGPAPCRPGTWGAETYGGLRLEASDILIKKHRYSAFIGTSLDLVLRSKGIATTVVCGTDGSVCVESTARHAYMLDYHVIVPTDLVSFGRPHLRDAFREVIGTWFGVLCSSEAVRSCWER